VLDVDRIRPIAQRPVSAKDGISIESPQRERGLWSFLTWAFFLSQLAVGNAFAGGAAQAANGIDSSALGNTTSTGIPATNALAPPDFRAFGSEETASAVLPVAAGQAHANESVPGPDFGIVERVDLAGDATTAVARPFATQGGSAPEGEANLPDAPHDVDLGIVPFPIAEMPPDIGLPPVLTDLLPPIFETIDDLVDSLGPTLDGLLSPVVETVADLADALGPTLDQVLSPVEALVASAASAVLPVIESVLAPIENVIEGVGELLEPIVGDDGPIVALAAPVIDGIESILSPVVSVAEAAQPVIEPVLDVVEPVLDVVQPIIGPILGNLPLGIGVDGESDVVASPGELQFAADADVAGHDLFQAGVYTEYGLALQEVPAANGIDAGDLLVNIAPTVDVLLGDDEHAGNHPPGLLGHLQHEAGLRLIGDGLI
jgi:hypothetical protein